MKTITRTLLALFVVSAGLAWATEGVLEEAPPAPASPIETLDTVTSGDDVTVEDLENHDVKWTAGGACCVVDCNAERIQCKNACSVGDTACLNECVDEFSECTAGC